MTVAKIKSSDLMVWLSAAIDSYLVKGSTKPRSPGRSGTALAESVGRWLPGWGVGCWGGGSGRGGGGERLQRAWGGGSRRGAGCWEVAGGDPCKERGEVAHWGRLCSVAQTPCGQHVDGPGSRRVGKLKDFLCLRGDPTFISSVFASDASPSHLHCCPCCFGRSALPEHVLFNIFLLVSEKKGE